MRSIGCLDHACNYNPLAWVDDSLCNYDSYNNVNISSCEYICLTVLYLFLHYYDTLTNVDGFILVSINLTSNPVSATINSFTPTSLNSCNGFISLSPTTGSFPFTYSWSNGSSSSSTVNWRDSIILYHY